MKPKPKIKKIKNSGAFLAFYESEDGKRYEAIGVTSLDAMDNWYKKFGGEFGYGG